MGVAPEATAKDLYLVVGSTPYAAIFSFYLPKFYNFSGARTALPMGVAPEAMNKCLNLVIGSRHFYFAIIEFFLFSEIALEHLIKNLYLFKGSRNNQYSCTVVLFTKLHSRVFPLSK